MFCSKCGAENKETAKFCFACGASIIFKIRTVDVDLDLQSQNTLSTVSSSKNKVLIRWKEIIGCLIALLSIGLIIVARIWNDNKKRDDTDPAKVGMYSSRPESSYASSSNINSNINIVKNGYLGDYTTVTIDEVLKNSFPNGKWEEGTVTDKNIVAVNYPHYTDIAETDVSETSKIQFEFTDDLKLFKVKGIEANGISPKNDEEAANIIQDFYLKYFASKYPNRSSIDFISTASPINILYGSANDFSGSRIFTEEIQEVSSKSDSSEILDDEILLVSPQPKSILSDTIKGNNLAVNLLGKNYDTIILELGYPVGSYSEENSILLDYTSFKLLCVWDDSENYTVSTVYIIDGFITDHFTTNMTIQELGLNSLDLQTNMDNIYHSYIVMEKNDGRLVEFNIEFLNNDLNTTPYRSYYTLRQ